MSTATPRRCDWCTDDPIYIRYHDEEWGVPVHEDNRLFELLVLEGAQAGLSWLTILRKREGYREIFEGFDPERLARWPDARLEKALTAPSIVRNRRKVFSVRQNALAVCELRESDNTFTDFLWQYVDGEPQLNNFRSIKQVPAETSLSQTLSGDLKRRGFSFVGPTIMYAFMQATGMVNDHLTTCFLHHSRAGNTRC
jgi:DNA-3-methyladenine glycosylase I